MAVHVEIRAYHGIKKYLSAADDNSHSRILSLPDGANVAQAMSALGIPSTEQFIAFLNGVGCRPDTILASGDILSIMQPAGGG